MLLLKTAKITKSKPPFRMKKHTHNKYQIYMKLYATLTNTLLVHKGSFFKNNNNKKTMWT